MYLISGDSMYIKVKNRKIKLNEANLKEAARTYSSESSSSSWKKTNEDYDAYCVTIGELMNKGLLEKQASLPEGLNKNTYIITNYPIIDNNKN